MCLDLPAPQTNEEKQELLPEDVRTSEERFALAIHGSNDGWWDCDLRTNTVYFSPRWKQLLGYVDNEIPNHFEEWIKRVHPDDLESIVMIALQQQRDGHQDTYEFDHRVRHKDGGYRWIHARGSALHDDQGIVYRIAGWHTDITRGRLEQEQAAIQERQRLARELHDSVFQALYGIVLGTGAARTLLHRDLEKLVELLDHVHAQAEVGLMEMRTLIFELRPESLETEGLVTALQKQVETVRKRYELEIVMELGEEPALSVMVKEALYRIAQEALHNIVKHAHATSAKLRLSESEIVTGVVLEVSDNGVGFNPAQSFPGHLGLQSMRERLARLGGTLEITSTPGRGTQIRAVIP